MHANQLQNSRLLACLAALACPLLAAEEGEPAITLGTVKVRANPGLTLPVTSVLTSVDILASDKLEDKQVQNSWELLGLMPGIQLTETRMGAESGKATFRAFNGEGYINGIKVLIDGVPSNVNSGNQRFIDMVFPLDLESIEVVRGTNDARYGLHNIGGNFNLETRQGGNYSDARLAYGSFNTGELQAALGREQGSFAQNYFFASQHSDGFRDHSDSDKYSLGGKWFFSQRNSLLKVGLSARLYHHEAEEPGFLTASELAADRRQSPVKNGNDGDERDMRQLVASADLRVTETLSLANKIYFNDYEDDRRVTFTSYGVGNAPRQRRQWDEKQTGFLNTTTWKASPWLTLDGGLGYEYQDNEYKRTRFNHSTVTDFSATPARVQNDDAYTLENFGAYTEAVLRPTASLKIVPAFRVDTFSGHTRLNTSGVTAPLQDYGWIEQPKLSLVYTLSPALSAYANIGQSFQILTGSREPAYLLPGQATYEPSTNTGKELGLKWRPRNGTDLRLALWQQDATDEVANMPSTGTTVGLGKTRRRGIDLQASCVLGHGWTLWASHAFQEAEVVSAFTASGTSLAGKEVFSTPRHISNLGLEFKTAKAWGLSIQARSQGDYFIDDLNEQGKFGGFLVVDASLRYQLTKVLSLDLQAKNLGNHSYEYVWYDNFFWGGANQPMFSPAPGRAVYLSLSLKL